MNLYPVGRTRFHFLVGAEWGPEYRKEVAKKRWLYEKAEDFVLELTIGMIYANFEGYFLTTHRRQPDHQERKVMTIIFQRLPRMKEALAHNCCQDLFGS